MKYNNFQLHLSDPVHSLIYYESVYTYFLLTDVFVWTQVGAAEVGTAGTGATRERKTGAGEAGKRETGERKTNCFCRSGNTCTGQHNCYNTVQS